MTFAKPRLRRSHSPKIQPIQAIELLLKTEYGTSLEWVNENTRRGDIIKLRQVVQVCLAKNTRMSFASIGELTGLKNHSTVIYSKNKIERMEYMFKKYGTLDELLTFYEVFEKRYFDILAKNNVSVQREYRSYKDELKCTS